MERERPLYYFGHELDGLKYSTYTTQKTNSVKPVTEENILGAYVDGLSWDRYLTGFIATPSNPYTGIERFWSTERKRPAYNNCVHLRDYDISYPYTYVHATYVGSAYNKWWYFQRNAVPYYTPQSITAYDGTLFNASARAWWNMQPRFQGEVSLINFLFELKDFRDIVSMLFKGKRSKLFHDRHFFRKHFRKLDPSYTLSVATLTQNFAIDPLIADVTKLIAMAQVMVADAQKEFFEQGDVLQKSHYSEMLKDETLSESALSTGIPRKTMVRESVKFTATLAYKYEFVPYNAYHAFMRYWGLRMTPEAIWNMLPFSFLGDYVAAIGQSLHAMEQDDHVDLEFHRYCQSLLQTRTSGVHLFGNSATKGYRVCNSDPVVGSITTPPFLSGRKTTAYKRWVTRPNKSLLLIKPKTPSAKQKRNVLALIRCLIG